MSKSAQNEIIRQLMDNAGDIIAAVKDGGPEKLTTLAHRQKHLTESMGKSLLHTEPGVSQTSVGALQILVAKAIDSVKSEMGRNRGSMLTTGIKKKVLRAYGTVTMSDK